MIDFKIDTSDLQKFLKDTDRKLSNATNKLRLLMKGKQGKIGLKAIAMLGTIPGGPVYPIRWKSNKQRRAFFASKGFGRGIPTGRKNVIINAWTAEVTTDPYGGVVRLTNPFDAWVYIQGSFVQPFHIDSGYVQLKDVADEFIKDGTLVIADAWLEASDPFG